MGERQEWEKTSIVPDVFCEIVLGSCCFMPFAPCQSGAGVRHVAWRASRMTDELSAYRQKLWEVCHGSWSRRGKSRAFAQKVTTCGHVTGRVQKKWSALTENLAVFRRNEGTFTQKSAYFYGFFLRICFMQAAHSEKGRTAALISWRCERRERQNLPFCREELQQKGRENAHCRLRPICF